MRRTVIVSLIAGVALALAALGGASEGPAQAGSSVENTTAGAAWPAQPIPEEEPVQGPTPGGSFSVPLDAPPAGAGAIYPTLDGRAYINAPGFPGTNRIEPYNWVADLTVTAQDSTEYQCTGFLIGPTTVITAGHCLYNGVFGGWAASIRTAPGKDGAAEPYGAQTVDTTHLSSVAGWVVGGDACFDYGAIILDRPFEGLEGPYFGYADIGVVDMEPRLSGYPGDKPDEQWFDDEFDALKFDSTVERITAVGPPCAGGQTVNYTLDTIGGQSGSPVWYPPADPHNTRHVPEVLAIHTRGIGDAACTPGDNCGRRVDAAAIANFEFWLDLNKHHYKCYQIDGHDPPDEVRLDTQFGTEGNVEVGQATLLCPPAVKNSAEGTLDIPDLECYDIVNGDDPPHVVKLTTQFGVEANVQVGEAKRLCVPVVKAIVDAADVPGAPHYKCYEIIGDDPPDVVSLETQFGTEPAVDVGQAALLCAPALKTVEGGNRYGDLNWAHLKCYDIAEPPLGPTVDLTSQFGAEQNVVVGAGRYVCAEAEKEIITPVGGIAEAPDIGDLPPEAADSPGGSSALPFALAGAGAAAVLAVIAGGWYTRRRWLR